MIACSIDSDTDSFIYLSFPAVSRGTLFCRECRRMIQPGEEHYSVNRVRPDEDGEEINVGTSVVCEECGDLLDSWLDAGFCWYYGELRADIAEAHCEKMI